MAQAAYIDRSRRRFERRLAAVADVETAKALKVLQAHKKAERARLKALAETKQETTKVVRLYFPDPVAATVQVGTPMLEVLAPAGRLLTDPDGAPLVDDHAAELAALRAQYATGNDYGPNEVWGVTGLKDGKVETQLFAGPLSAIRTLWPDDYTREKMQQAGVQDMDDLGRAYQVERYAD